jgi:hypothetical protein
MKDLDSLLSKQKLAPSKELDANFTSVVIAEIRANPHGNTAKNRWAFRFPRHLSKLALILLLGVSVATGTAAAVALWPEPKVTPTISKPLTSGNRIVGVNAENCGRLDGNYKLTFPTSHKSYYEVRQGSKLTDQQVADMVRGLCDEDMNNYAVKLVFDKIPGDFKGRQQSPNYTVQAISSGSITVSLDPILSKEHYGGITPNQTFSRYLPNLITQKRQDPIVYNDIHPGDSVILLTQDTSGKSTEPEMSASQPYIPFNHPENMEVLAIVKVPPLLVSPSLFYSGLTKDFVRVEPCTSNPEGYCRAYDFTNQQ